MQKSKLFVGFAALALILAGCSGDEEKPASSTSGNPTTSDTSAPAGTSNTGPAVTSNTAPGVTSNTSVTPSPTSAGTSVSPTPTSAGTSVTPSPTVYTITFDVEGELTPVQTEANQIPSYPGTPAKVSTEQYDYVFSGWLPALAPATANATYVAQFTPQTRQYKVTFLNDDMEEVLKQELFDYNAIPVAPTDPAKASTAQYTYTFSGWDHPIEAVHGEQTYVATYQEHLRSYSVRFIDDESNLIHEDSVAYGSTPTYPLNPQKTATAEYTYSFDHWDKELEEVHGEQTYTAIFNSSKNHYDVHFVGEDGLTPLHTINDVEYGTAPVYSEAEPTKAKTSTVTYIFDGWTSDNGVHIYASNNLPVVQGEITYQAHFSETETKYTVKFVNWDDTQLGELYPNVDYSDENAVNLYDYDHEGSPTCDENPGVNYAFDGFVEQPKDTVNYYRIFKATFHPVSSKPSALTYTFDGEHNFYTVTGFSSYDCPILTIPSSYNDGEHGEYPVTGIGNNAFKDRSIESVHIPASVTSIGSYAFAWIEELTDVVIEGNPNLAERAFYDCEKLENFTMNGTGEYTIGNYVFMNSKMTNVTLGEKLTSLGVSAFAHSQISSFGPFNYLTEISARAFEDCALLEDLDLGTSVQTLGYYAFASCVSLNSVTIPDSVTSINTGGCFYDCGELEFFKVGAGLTNFYSAYLGGNTRVGEYRVSSDPAVKFSVNDGVLFNKEGTRLISVPSLREGTYVIPEGTTEIATMAFAYTSNLEQIDFCEGITHIPQQAFYGCGATVINLPDSLISIGDHAFTNCGVTSLIIPLNVSSIEANAFVDAQQISEIEVDSHNTHFYAKDLVMYNAAKDTLLFVLSCKDGSFTTPEGVTNLGSYAFYGSMLDSVTISDEVINLGDHCFTSYNGEVVLGNSLTYIPSYCFSYTEFEHITLPEGIVYLGQHAFDNADVTEIELPDSCTTIQQNCFENATELTSIDLNQVQTIGGYAFQYSGIESLTIPSSVTSLGQGAIAQCKIQTLDMSAVTLNYVPAWFSVNNYYLTTVTLNPAVQEIRENAFKTCRMLSSFNWSDLTALTTLGSESFGGCQKMSSIVLPATLTSIGSSALTGNICTNIIYSGTSSDWANATFKANRASNWFSWPSEAGLKFVTCSDSVSLDLFNADNR